ncbi:MAG: S8 family serine peptidase [Candidatus Cloacimonetes bacterium]|nr:S8 family serine peptidase [Candidatus Cloacimonadota bacterium]
MKKLLFAIILVVCLTGLLFAELDFCDKTVVVVLKPSHSEFTGSRNADFFGDFEKVSVENIFQIHNESAIRALNERNPGQFRSIYKITLPTNDKAKVLEAIEELRTIEGIESATPDYIVPIALIPNDPLWDHPGLWNMWGTHGVQAPDAWDITVGDHEVRVGIIDTGVASHTDLDANMSFTGWNFAENNSVTHDTHSHGTRSAGIVGAVGNNNIGVVGVNWNVTMVPMKIVVGGSGSSSGTIMTAAVNWATNNWGSDNELQILTMSFSGYGTITDLRAAIGNFPGLFVWSAGNDGVNVDSRIPQYGSFNLPNLIAVGAIDVNGQRSVWGGGQSSAYSASGDHVHVFAPGTDGWTTGLNNGYQDYGGTSMAAPHAAGVAALLMSVNPAITPAEMKEIMMENHDPITISTPLGQQVVRRLNAFASVSAVQPLLFDLAAFSINTLIGLPINSPSIVYVGLENRGSEPAEGYNVRIMQVGNDTPLAWASGIYIAPEETGILEIEWIPSILGDYEIYGEVVWQFDQRASNDMTEIFELRVIPEGSAEAYLGNRNSEIVRNNAFVNYNSHDSITQTIYLENELTTGYIYQMTVQFTGMHTLVFPGSDIQIYLATTDKTSFESTSDWVPYERFKNVYSGDFDAFEAGTYEIDLKFHTPFKYEGDNLVVMVVKDDNVVYGIGNAFQFTDTPGINRTIWWRSNMVGTPTINPLPNANGLQDGITNTRFTIYTFDIEPPQNLLATVIQNENKINLSWDTPKEQLFGTLTNYKIYRNGVLISQLPSRSFSDENVIYNAETEYWVTAVYSDPSVESEPSNVVTVTIERILPPQNLLFEVIDDDTVVLTWDTVSNKLSTYGIPTGFQVFRNEVPLTENPIQEISFTEYEVPVGIHIYGVVALYQTGKSDPVLTEVEIKIVSDNDNPTPVFETSLLGNYPNPFNPETLIQFSMADAGNVSIDIFNIRGQKVRSLFNAFVDRGNHNVIWNGLDDNSTEVGSGIYFYVMKTEDFSHVKRMMMIK